MNETKDESYDKISLKDIEISKLMQASKLKWQLEKYDVIITTELANDFKELGVDSGCSYDEIQDKIKVVRLERKILFDQFEEVTEELNQLNMIQAIAEKNNKDHSNPQL